MISAKLNIAERRRDEKGKHQTHPGRTASLAPKNMVTSWMGVALTAFPEVTGLGKT
jgi:hypothetical protein